MAKKQKQYDEWEDYETNIMGVGSCWGDMRGKPKTKKQIGFVRQKAIVRQAAKQSKKK